MKTITFNQILDKYGISKNMLANAIRAQESTFPHYLSIEKAGKNNSKTRVYSAKAVSLWFSSKQAKPPEAGEATITFSEIADHYNISKVKLNSMASFAQKGFPAPLRIEKQGRYVRIFSAKAVTEWFAKYTVENSRIIKINPDDTDDPTGSYYPEKKEANFSNTQAIQFISGNRLTLEHTKRYSPGRYQEATHRDR